ncbi:helix-turn-helix domain-containing protein [Paenibacillus popilliae]|jgi:transcriptional regulator with XRE-family HTH domain|uniref:Transcriptional regulator n=1 Tax=Paenibacillus popilliae ATCC 14706 TaxID=1212764 RepID=M9LPF5_PAEPP|nr:helix-turn-helix transcriptional regulator [Paenibacillus popilliae]BAQ95620.1 transcriptional regulator [Paenibacillus popilliae ATCC 14706]GAC42421.1 predicted transcriptional regulator [Paenibacillus popilliae ATCC 14706]
MQTETFKVIGLKIREFRKLRNLTQDQLAEAIDSTGSYIGRIERGEQNVTLHTLEKVAETLQISVFDLFDIKQRNALKNTLIWETVSLLLEQSESRQRKGLNILKEVFKPE